MVLILREFVRTRDPLICDPPIRDPLNTYTVPSIPIQFQSCSPIQWLDTTFYGDLVNIG